MTEHPMDDVVGRLAEGYNRPPATPREEMWAAIQAGMEARRPDPVPDDARVGDDGDVVPIDRGIRRPEATKRASRPAGRWTGWAVGVAAAAVLALGIGIGRWSVAPDGELASGSPDGGTAPVVAAGDEGLDGQAGAVRMATLEHLGKAEPLLSAIRVDAANGRVDRDVGEWGRRLLSETRMLLDADQGRDPGLQRLLEDLELILAQVTILSRQGGVDDERGREELRLIAQGMDDQDVMTRIQTALPAGPGLANMDE